MSICADRRITLGSFPSVSTIIRDVDRLPSAPKVIPRLMHLLDDGNSSPSEVSAMVRLDPGIASRVLRVANSIYYGKGVRIHSVEEAVTRIGYLQIFDIVSVAAASLVMDPSLGLYGLQAGEAWNMSISCALGAEALALQCGADRNLAYTTGLLHNVGMVALDAFAFRNGLYAPFPSREGFPVDWQRHELRLLGHTHAEIGAELLVSWEFPRSTTVPMRWQNSPAGCLSYKREAALLHAAKWISAMVLCAGAPPPLPSHDILDLLRLSPSVLIRLAGEVRIRFLAVRHLLEEV